MAQSKVGPTKEELDIAQKQVALALATVADLEAQLAKTTLTSPVDGIARLLVAERGEAISPGQPVLTLGVGGDRWFTFTIREDRLQGLTMGSKVALRTAAGDHFEAKVTELRPLGEFAVWRAARAVGDHDINSFLLRADPVGPTPKLEPGMTVWIDEGQAVARRVKRVDRTHHPRDPEADLCMRSAMPNRRRWRPGERPGDLTEQEAAGYDVATALINGSVLPEPTYRCALALFEIVRRS